MGCTFRTVLQAESASQNIALEWDAVSGWHHLRKRRPILIIRNEKELELRIVERLSSFSKTNLLDATGRVKIITGRPRRRLVGWLKT